MQLEKRYVDQEKLVTARTGALNNCPRIIENVNVLGRIAKNFVITLLIIFFTRFDIVRLSVDDCMW